jgi:hypothetical protein
LERAKTLAPAEGGWFFSVNAGKFSSFALWKPVHVD